MVESIVELGDIGLIGISLGLFFVAALMEIGGGYLVWQWLREKKGIVLGLVGGIVLALFLPFNHLILEGLMLRMGEYSSFPLLYGGS